MRIETAIAQGDVPAEELDAGDILDMIPKSEEYAGYSQTAVWLHMVGLRELTLDDGYDADIEDDWSSPVVERHGKVRQ